MRLLKCALIPAIMAAFLLSSSGVAAASTPTSISGNVTCNDGVVTGVWVDAYSGEDGWASWDVPIRAGGHDEADFQFTLDNGGWYTITVGCSDVSSLFHDDWGTTVESDWVLDADPIFYCNSMEDYRIWGVGWIKWFEAAYRATDPPEYGKCVQVA